jgi:sulfur carrier protein
MLDATNKINIQVNGENQTCGLATPLPELLTQLQLNPRLIAVEYNGEILA